jgi:hypothetical protein
MALEPLTKVSTLLGFALGSPTGRAIDLVAGMLGPAMPGRYDAQGNFDEFSPAIVSDFACETPL